MRHAFDQFEIPFGLIFKERVGEGDLRSDYDIILVPNQGRTGKGLVFDVDPRAAPLVYTKTDQYRFLGDYGSSEDITRPRTKRPSLTCRVATAGSVLFATNPCYRWQNHDKFTLLVNTILDDNDFDAAATTPEAALQD